MKRFLFTLVLAVLALPVSAQQTIVFHPKQWKAEWQPFSRLGYHYPAGRWQHITAPSKESKWLIPYLEYDDQTHVWEVEEGARLYWGWTPLQDGDVLTMDEDGFIKIKGL